MQVTTVFHCVHVSTFGASLPARLLILPGRNYTIFRGSMTRPACSILSGSFVRAPLGTAHASSVDLWARLWPSMDFHHLGNNIGFLNLLVLPTDWDLSGRENDLLYLPDVNQTILTYLEGALLTPRAASSFPLLKAN